MVKFKNFITTPTKGDTGSGHWFGSAHLQLGGKDSRTWQKFIVCNHLVKGKEYEFRSSSKCQAGFTTISDFKCKAEHLWYHITKSTTCVQVKKVYPNSKVVPFLWLHVYLAQAGLWHTIDVLMLDNAKVGDLHSSAPKMVSWPTLEIAKSKYHTCNAFVINTKNKKK